MKRTSVASAAQTLVKVAEHLDKLGMYQQADTVLSCIRIAQNATQSLLGDVPGGFYMQNLNSTAYGLKNGMGGYPGSGHSYWDDKGGETARQVDLRNNMMGQGGMTGQDRVNFELQQWAQNQKNPQYLAWAAGQDAQMEKDMLMMKSRLQDPSLSPDDKESIQKSIEEYASAIDALKKWRNNPTPITSTYF